MVYRCLDPGRDWDAWCDDHPDPPELEQIDVELYISKCCGGEVDEIRKNSYRCQWCGLFCTIDEEATVENALDKWARDADEAKGEAAYERMMDERDYY